MYLFKRVADDMIVLLLIKQVAQLIQSISPMILLVSLSLILKSMHLTLLQYLSLKALLIITRSTYCIICQNNTYTNS